MNDKVDDPNMDPAPTGEVPEPLRHTSELRPEHGPIDRRAP